MQLFFFYYFNNDAGNLSLYDIISPRPLGYAIGKREEGGNQLISGQSTKGSPKDIFGFFGDGNRKL